MKGGRGAKAAGRAGGLARRGGAARPVVAAVAPGANEADLRESASRLRDILDTMPQMVWSTRPDGFHDYYNERWYEFTGVPPGSTDGDGWNGLFHPHDQPRAWERWRHSLATGEPYEIEYRLRRRDGQYRWTLGRALPIRDREGRIERWFGTCTDIHELKQLEEQRELIARELSHRIKNIFAVTGSLIALTSRGDPGAQAFAAALRERLDALARAHHFVRPAAADGEAVRPADTLLGLVAALVAPYAGAGGGAERFAIAGKDAPIGPQAATTIALIVHELATNAVKYGALSRPGGQVRITGAEDGAGRYGLVWQERGGPPIAAAPVKKGFGSVMVQRGASLQLEAEIVHDWAPEGLTVTLLAPLGALCGGHAG